MNDKIGKPSLSTFITVGLGDSDSREDKVILAVSHDILGFPPREAKRIAVQLLMAADELEARLKEGTERDEDGVEEQ